MAAEMVQETGQDGGLQTYTPYKYKSLKLSPNFFTVTLSLLSRFYRSGICEKRRVIKF